MLGIVVVTYNSEQVIGACLDSCLALGSAADVLVVDNNSADGTLSEVRKRPGVRLIANTENRGFAGGVNQGCSALNTEHVLLLNPDAVLQTSLGPLLDALDDPAVGATTGMLIGPDGKSQHEFHLRKLPTPAVLLFEILGINRLWPSNPVNRRYRSAGVPTAICEVEQPAAAFLLIKRTAWLGAGGFDERFYPVWFEDVDFCKRLREAGFRILYVPGVTARHQGGHSAASMRWETRHKAWYGSLLRYVAKHFSPSARRIIALSVLLGSLVRSMGEVLVLRSLKPMTAYISVVRLASLYLRSEVRRGSFEAACPVKTRAGAVSK